VAAWNAAQYVILVNRVRILGKHDKIQFELLEEERMVDEINEAFALANLRHTLKTPS